MKYYSVWANSAGELQVYESKNTKAKGDTVDDAVAKLAVPFRGARVAEEDIDAVSVLYKQQREAEKWMQS